MERARAGTGERGRGQRGQRRGACVRSWARAVGSGGTAAVAARARAGAGEARACRSADDGVHGEGQRGDVAGACWLQRRGQRTCPTRADVYGGARTKNG